MDGALDMQGLLHAILTCVTAGPGLGFNRAVLFLADEEAQRLVATMAIGPASPEEAGATWAKLASEQKSLDELLHAQPPTDDKNRFQRLVEGLVVPLHGEATAPGAASGAPGAPADSAGTGAETAGGQGSPLVEAFRSRTVVRMSEPAALEHLPPPLRELFTGTEVACVPLVAQGSAVGLIVADNAFNREPIDDERIQLLQVLALLAGLALDNARILRQVEDQARQLENALEELRAAQEKLLHRERLATVGAVVARVSHEIRNPLATVGGFAARLASRPEDVEMVRRNAAIIVEEVGKLETLLRETLDFTGPRAPALVAADLGGAVAEFAERHGEELAEHGVVLTLDLAPALPAVAMDRAQMQRVFLNLWRNALQALEATPPDRLKTLAIRAWRDDSSVKVAFSDSGEGIRAEQLPRLFTPFFTSRRHGTGLGLAAVKTIIDEHRGTIDVTSAPGEGAAFVITLPIAR